MLYDSYCKHLLTTIYNIINDYDAANDILQETFIEAFLKLKTLIKKSSFKYWIKKIAVRKAIRYLKNMKSFDSIDNYQNIEDTSWNEDFTAEYLHKAILSLPDRVRAVFVLVEIEGYKHREVAGLLNISEGTSKSQLNYSKKILRKKLEELYNK